MSFPKSIQSQLLAQFVALISDGDALRNSLTHVLERVEYHDNRNAFVASQREPTSTVHPAHDTCDPEPMREWLIRCTSLMGSIIPTDHVHYSELVLKVSKMYPDADAPKNVLPILRAISKDFELGVFDPIADRIQAAFASDYMSQAEELLDLKSKEGVDHVPAAVLAGAVLERHLREMCINRSRLIRRSGEVCSEPAKWPRNQRSGTAGSCVSCL